MKILVLDPRSGDFYSELFALNPADGAVEKIGLGYVPELHYDPAARELTVVETELKETTGKETRYLLKRYDADTLNLTFETETPERPMYAGFPGRSTHVAVSPSGRYTYILENKMVLRRRPAEDVYGLTVYRHDRVRDTLTRGAFTVESCMIDFGHMGLDDDELYLHLSCDFPSTIVFGKFSSPELEYLKVEDLPSRTHSPRETCGSWLDRRTGALFCVTGEGKIYRARSAPPESALLLRLPLSESRSVPLHHIHGGGGHLFVGVARNEEERSLSLASEIWQVHAADAAVVKVITLPFPVMNFVANAAGDFLVGVSPYERALVFVDATSGKVLACLPDVGFSPAEVLLVE